MPKAIKSKIITTTIAIPEKHLVPGIPSIGPSAIRISLLSLLDGNINQYRYMFCPRSVFINCPILVSVIAKSPIWTYNYNVI